MVYRRASAHLRLFRKGWDTVDTEKRQHKPRAQLALAILKVEKTLCKSNNLTLKLPLALMLKRRRMMEVILKGELARNPRVSINTFTCQKVDADNRRGRDICGNRPEVANIEILQ